MVDDMDVTAHPEDPGAPAPVAPEGSGAPTPVAPEGPGAPAPVAPPVAPGESRPPGAGTRGRSRDRDPRMRKLLLLALLLLLIGLLTWVAYYVNANRRLPLPQTSSSSEQAIELPVYLYSISGTGRAALTRPVGVAVGSNGRVYVADHGAQSIKVYTLAGAFLFEFRNVADGKATHLRSPVHLALDSAGNLWVTDRGLRGVYIFDPDGKFLRKYQPNGDAAFQWTPLALTLGKDGSLFTSDVGETKEHRIRIFDPSGKELVQFGRTNQVYSAKDAPGEFYFPNGLAVRESSKTAQRELFVADGDNRRIQVFTTDGVFKRLILTEGVPRGIYLDSKTPVGLVLLSADAISNQVDIYSLDGKLLGSFGEPGILDGQFRFPNDVGLDGQGRIYVTDRENNRVQVWGWAKGEIPGITKLPAGIPPWACALPLLLLLIPILRRKRRFLATDDFVEGMIVAEAVTQMDQKRFRWIVPEHLFPPLEGRVVDGVHLSELLEPEPYSHSDASELAERMQVSIEVAGVLSMAKRYKNLCTEDARLTQLAGALDIKVYDRVAWLEEFSRKETESRPGDDGGR